MLVRIGFFALCFVVASEAFAASAAITWPIVSYAHFGIVAERVDIGVCILLGIAAGVFIGRLAARNAASEMSTEHSM